MSTQIHTLERDITDLRAKYNDLHAHLFRLDGRLDERLADHYVRLAALERYCITLDSRTRAAPLPPTPP